MSAFTTNISLLAGILLFISTQLAGQSASIHEEEFSRHKALGISPEAWQAINEQQAPARAKSGNDCRLQKRVFGWHPYWSNGLEAQYDWGLLSDLSYFAYEVNAATGQALNTYNWATAPVVTQALANDTRVHLCVTLFSNHATFFGNATARQTLITNLISLVQQRGAHGVNIDFEAAPAAQSANLTAFIIALGTQLHTALPDAELSVALPAVDWSTVFNVAAMNAHVDLFIIMGYDYYWSGSAQAGPTDPMYSFTGAYNYNHARSIAYYLNAGIPREKLLLGLPYYGREWETASDQIPANTTGNFHASRTYKAVRDNSATYAERGYHPASMSSYYLYPSGNTWRQCFINSEHTLGRRYQLALQRGLAGVGIWALGYDAGYDDLWNLLRDHFTDCAVQVCSDTLYDSGGPAWNYYHNENYSFTIAPEGAASLSVNFLSFELENGYDSLWIYDGPSTAAPLMGAYTGADSPGAVQASGGSLTFRFRSDVGVAAPGWTAVYECSTVSDAGDPDNRDNRPLVFPNPATAGAFNVQYVVERRETVHLEIWDMNGRRIHVNSQEQAPGRYETLITLPQNMQPKGVFLLRLRIGEKVWTERVLLH